MLTTRCPNCHTVFRINSTALHQAEGRVRCGQCTLAFLAFDSLTDTTTGLSQSTVTRALTEPPIDAFEIIDTDSSDHLEQAIVDETGIPAETPETGDSVDLDAISEQQVDKVLDARKKDEEIWRLPDFPAPEPPASASWRYGTALAGLLLAIQTIYFFRLDLIDAPYIGETVEKIFTTVGLPIYPDINPAAFEIIDWLASAQEIDPKQDEDQTTSALSISAGIRNTSAEALPYPLLSLRLTDRWDNQIAQRTFAPNEYLADRVTSSARIDSGTTANATLELVDPGPDAYGFEVDICVESSASMMRCKSDLAAN